MKDMNAATKYNTMTESEARAKALWRTLECEFNRRATESDVHALVVAMLERPAQTLLRVGRG
jgi:hypothetical protein